MANWLKQSTSASVVVGPFIDELDGVTSKESFSSLSGMLYKNSASDTVNPNVVHTASGFYNLELDSGSTGTLGRLRIAFSNSASHLPVWRDFIIVPANTYDSLVGGTDDLDVTVGGSGLGSNAIAEAAANLIADHVIRREFGNAASSADGDTKTLRSLLGAVAKLVNKIDSSGSALEIFEADDATLLGSQTVTSSSSASPIVTVDTN